MVRSQRWGQWKLTRAGGSEPRHGDFAVPVIHHRAAGSLRQLAREHSAVGRTENQSCRGVRQECRTYEDFGSICFEITFLKNSLIPFAAYTYDVL
jgi:hypothetical protein